VEAIQSRLLDSLGPLSALHAACYDAMTSGVKLNPLEVAEGVSTAISLVGNANSQACRERRRLILRKVSPDLVTYSSKMDLTNDSNLFGDELWKQMKTSIDFGKDLKGLMRKSRDSKESIRLYLSHI
jgi:hypothetical protein